MKISDIIAPIEQAAPLRLQESYDNAGLIVGHADAHVDSALICVDVTDQVMDEAEELGAGIVISHHPIIFHPIKRLTGGNYIQRIVERAIRRNIALYASHTNLDGVTGGMSFRVAEMLGLKDIAVLSPSDDEGNGSGIIGILSGDMPSLKFMQHLKNTLRLEVIRHSDICTPAIRKVALCTGAGAFLIDTAAEAGADIFVASDFKYNDFLDADGRLIVADIGHFESEYCAIDLIYDIIRKKLPTFALHKSVNSRNPINYMI